MNIPLKYIDYGIGFYCKDGDNSWIELNRHLKRYPALHNEVLQHELGHASLDNKHIDFWHDFKDFFNIKKNMNLTKFSLRHPSALLSISPVFFTKKGIAPNWFMCVFWGFMAFSLVGIGALT